MSLTLGVGLPRGWTGPYTVPLPPDYWMDALNCTQQNPVRARPPNHQTQRRIWSVHPRADLRLLPSRAAHDAAPAGEAVRLGREARRRCAAHALLGLRQKAMHGACGAVDGTARLQVPLGDRGPYPTTKRRVGRRLPAATIDRPPKRSGRAQGGVGVMPCSCRSGLSGASGMSSKLIRCALPSGSFSSMSCAAAGSVTFRRNATPLRP